MDQVFLKDVQNFIANSFNASIIRGMAGKGALAQIQSFLKRIDLAQISKCDPAQYRDKLDSLTDELLAALPAPDREKWGMARKCLNLFFRDAFYNFYLRSAHNLQKLEAEFEIPLDGQVGKKLNKENPKLPRWKSVIGLRANQSAAYQAAALEIAKNNKTHRVHLDVKYWRRSDDDFTSSQTFRSDSLRGFINVVVSATFRNNPSFLKTHLIPVDGTEKSVVAFNFDDAAFRVAFDMELTAALWLRTKRPECPRRDDFIAGHDFAPSSVGTI
jgi:hypothetical protein